MPSQHFDEFFGWSHLPQQCDETKISSPRSQVTRCDELIGLVQYLHYISVIWEGPLHVTAELMKMVQ